MQSKNSNDISGDIETSGYRTPPILPGRQYKDRLFKAIFGREEHKPYLLDSQMNLYEQQVLGIHSVIRSFAVSSHRLRQTARRRIIRKRVNKQFFLRPHALKKQNPVIPVLCTKLETWGNTQGDERIKKT